MEKKRTTRGLIRKPQDVPKMNKRTRSSSRAAQNIPKELIQHIQSLMPAEEAARTCVLCKSWRDAWSTTPNLRFPKPGEKKKGMKDWNYNKLIHATLRRYHRHKLPIQRFHLESDVKNDKGASLLVDQLIRPLASKSCLKELSLKIGCGALVSPFALPDEILSSKTLTTINILDTDSYWGTLISISSSTAVINCVSLRVLEFQYVNIPENVLDNLLSTCTLIEKIHLICCHGFNTVKVKSLRCLHHLNICLLRDQVLEIDDVPSLGLLDYTSINDGLPFNMESLGSVTELYITCMIMDQAWFDIIKSKFLFLESLTLGEFHKEESFVITSTSLKSLVLLDTLTDEPVDVQVYAPNLCYCKHDSNIRLSFPITIANPELLKIEVVEKGSRFIMNPKYRGNIIGNLKL